MVIMLVKNGFGAHRGKVVANRMLFREIERYKWIVYNDMVFSNTEVI